MDYYGKKNSEQSYLSQERRYRALRYGYRIVKGMNKSDFCQNLVHLCLCYNHTCVLKLNTFFLGWDMIAKNFSFHSYPYKSYKSPPTIMANFFCDVKWIWSIAYCDMWSHDLTWSPTSNIPTMVSTPVQLRWSEWRLIGRVDQVSLHFVIWLAICCHGNRV